MIAQSLTLREFNCGPRRFAITNRPKLSFCILVGWCGQAKITPFVSAAYQLKAIMNAIVNFRIVWGCFAGPIILNICLLVSSCVTCVSDADLHHSISICNDRLNRLLFIPFRLFETRTTRALQRQQN